MSVEAITRARARMELVPQISELVNLLAEAHEHLLYCGFGDAWERECAQALNLPKRLKEALERYEEYIHE